MKLLKQRRFLPYFATQFLGAFNDNVFKSALVILLTFKIVSEQSNILVNVAAVVFILPFFLFSPLAGQLADKHEKSTLIRRIKWVEIGIMLLGVIGLAFNSVAWLMCVLFLMGTQSAFFGPIKYSILPQHLDRDELMNGNALVEGGTFLAILLGTILGGVLANFDPYVLPISIAIVGFSTLGLVTSYFIPSAAADDPQLTTDYNPWRSGKRIFSALKSDKSNFYTVFGISWFWFFGATFLTQLPNFSLEYLHGGPFVATLLMAMFSIGIGLGSWLASRLSRGRVELGLVPLGALGMTLFGLWLGALDFSSLAHLTSEQSVSAMFQHSAAVKALLALLGLSLSGGLFIVPLYAHIQANTPSEYLSRNIAANNILNALLMVIAGIFAIFSFALGNSIQGLFIIVALMNVVVGLFIFKRVPEFILQMSAWLLMHSLYRIGKYNLTNIPKEGPAILVCNHVGFVDAAIVGAIITRPVRFVMHYKLYNTPVALNVFKAARVIPIATAKEDPQLLDNAYDGIANALQRGELVCIFPEGKLTTDGTLQEFKPGISRILERTAVPVIPMALRGLWGTWFSRVGGRAMKGWPRNWMKKIDLIIGTPVATAQATPERLQQCVQTLLQASDTTDNTPKSST